MRYFKKLKGLNDDNNLVCVPNRPIKSLNKKYKNNFLKSKKKYGYAAEETWSVDYTAGIWLYEHLRMLQEIGGKIVNHNWEHEAFTEEEKKVFLELNISPKTDNEIFDYICEHIEKAFECYEEDLDDEGYIENLTKAFKLWSVTFSRAWW